jgi:uncharacterized UPF0160 family protein
MKVVTHNGRCHADDVFATATLQLKFGEGIEVVRTRDEGAIAEADIVYDVGHTYSPADRRFDHHQPDAPAPRENGVPYAAFGLVWKEFGEEICGDAEVARRVDEKLVQSIDAVDNGFATFDVRPGMPEPFSVDSAIGALRPTWLEDETRHDAAFFEAVTLARRTLERVIDHESARVKGNALAREAYEKAEDRRLLVLDGPYPHGAVTDAHPEILFSVSPDVFAGRWNLKTVQDESFVSRKLLPEAWAGLRDGDLERATGVSGAVFCHRGRWFCAVKTKEAALALAALALAE